MGVGYLQYLTLSNTGTTLNKTLIANNRAWIVPHLLKLIGPLKSEQEAAFLLTYGNSGKAPAKNVGHANNSKSIGTEGLVGATTETGVLLLRDMIAKANFTDTCAAAKEKRVLGVVYPGPLDGYYTAISTKPEWITQPTVDGGAFIVVKGCFVYETMGEPHRSEYCLFYNKKLDDLKPQEYRNYLSNCPTGNDAD